MSSLRFAACFIALTALNPLLAQTRAADESPQAARATSTEELLRQLRAELAAHEARIKELEEKLERQSGKTAAEASALPVPAPAAPASPESTSLEPDIAAPAERDGHEVHLGGGPALNIRGFTDFNFGLGSIANPLVFPVTVNGCQTCGNPPTPARLTFQAGQLDLFITSKLSDHLSFLSEVAISSGASNAFDIDVERYQLTYRANEHFSLSGGRFHTSIGYYNTAYHHGNWFSTAEGRPIMYLFEDAGGLLPVHMVGISATGLVPHTGKLNLNWTAEMGNGRNSNNSTADPVQNFYSDRDYKAFNIAAFIKPEWMPGLQIGGSIYHDRLSPLGLSHINQNIGSLYAVFVNSNFEFLNEAVILQNHLHGMSHSYNTPMAYTQVARRFGIFDPYFRFQYVNARVGDPVNILHGLYYGPSIGLRIDLSQYVAFKLQYNRLFETNKMAENGLNAQVAFAF